MSKYTYDQFVSDCAKAKPKAMSNEIDSDRVKTLLEDVLLLASKVEMLKRGLFHDDPLILSELEVYGDKPEEFCPLNICNGLTLEIVEGILGKFTDSAELLKILYETWYEDKDLDTSYLDGCLASSERYKTFLISSEAKLNSIREAVALHLQ